MSTQEQRLSQHIGNLISIGFRLSNPMSQLLLIREKISVRGYQFFDKPDIMDELGRLQHIAGELHSEMLHIQDLLKQEESK